MAIQPEGSVVGLKPDGIDVPAVRVMDAGTNATRK